MYSELLWVFIPAIATISLSPGMCMTLTCTLGLSQGYRRTLWMMWGELAGVATVVSTCVLLLAKIQSLAELLFAALALVSGSYLLWIAQRLRTQPARFTGDGNQPHVSQRVAHLGIRHGDGEPERLGVHDCVVARIHVRGVLNAPATRRVSGRDAALGISVNDALCHGRERCQAITHFGAAPRQLTQGRGGFDGAGYRLDAFQDLSIGGATDQMPGAQLA